VILFTLAYKGVGGSIKIMNYKFFSMNFTYLKKMAPVMVIFAVVLAVLNFGTYNPYQELAVLTPDAAEATLLAGSLTIPTLSTPTLTAPTLTTTSVSEPQIATPVLSVPELDVPTLETPVLSSSPDLSVPTLSTPELSAPTLDVPTLEVPELSVPTPSTPTLEVPELSVPTLSTPTLEVPSLTVPTLTIPTLTIPTLEIPELTPGTTTFSSCTVNANSQTVTTGSSVTINWTTQGFATVTINGEAMTNLSGSKTYTNVQANTTYTLIAKTADGKSNCTTSVTVLCLPPVAFPTCTELGYDLTAATFNWNGHLYVKESGLSDYQITVAGDGVRADWTSNKLITAVIAKAGTVAKTFPGGFSGTVTKCDIGTGCADISTIRFCANKPVPEPAPTCTLTPTTKIITEGESVNLTWTTTNAANVSLTEFGAVSFSGTKNTGALFADKNYTLTVLGTNGQTVTCNSSIVVNPDISAPVCPIVPQTGRVIVNFTDQKLRSDQTLAQATTLPQPVNLPAGRYDVTLASWDGYLGRETITQPNESYFLNLFSGTEVSATSNSISDLADSVREASKVEKVNTNLTLTSAISAIQAKHTVYPDVTSANSLYPICAAFDPITPDPVPSCDAFSATPTTITKGESASLNWVTSNATSVAINNGIGAVAATGTLSVTPLATTEYLLTVFGGTTVKDTCTTTVVVEVPEVRLPVCEFITATPASLPVGGGNVTLAWSTLNATSVAILPTIGTVPAVGTTTVAITASTNFTLTAVSGTSSDQCVVNVPVATPEPTPITCAANVNFTASPTTFARGNATTLAWSTTGITGVSFDNGITATGLSGSVSVTPLDSTTYTLSATDGTTTIACPVAVTVTTSGGGGGSSSPRCELSVSKNKINSGESVELIWDSTRATELFIEDQTTDTKIVSTENLLGDAKDRLLDGAITVSPKKDTTYLLTVKRGSTTRTCSVDVEIDDNVVVTQIRDQQPLVASISLTQVPYTGFEAGPILTLLFYTLLMAWALYVAYLLVIRRDVIGGLQLAMNKTAPTTAKLIPEMIRPDVFVAQVKAPEMPVSTLTPHNLPTGAPVIGYANQAAKDAETAVVSSNLHNIDDAEMTRIENHAHAKRVLLSSDAIRHFIATTSTTQERTEALDQVIAAAKSQFPAEDGWIVLNEKRMQDLCLVCAANQMHSSETPYIPAVIPEGAGSLAEAIVTGNVVASYELIGHRPMFALADAAADLDAVYRIRRGGAGAASELLMKETAALTDEQILQMIEALTGALDGTYTDEASAVKMSIMKAIKVVA
jgi:hypothetical protein